MSHRAISGQQFGEQLKMFMTPDEIIDTVHKNDSRLSGHMWSPRAQWEHPESGYDYKNSAADVSLRQEKLGRLEQNEHVKKDFNRSWLSAPPVEIFHAPESGRFPSGRKSAWQPGKTLTEGHHRLAYAEQKKIPYIAVTHHWYGA